VIIHTGQFEFCGSSYRYKITEVDALDRKLFQWFPEYNGVVQKWDGVCDNYYFNFTEEEIMKLWALINL